MLASIPNLRVISSETIRTFANRDVNLLEAARKMDVTHIVAGAVRRAGNRVRVAVELFDAAEDTQIWAQSYEREIDDIFAIQDDIAARVVGELRLELSDEPPTSEQINPRAYELYLKGHHLTHSVRTQEAFVEAERLLAEAVELEPGYVPAIWSLARAIVNQDHDEPSGKQAADRRVRKLVDRMVELAPDSSYANGWLAAFAWEAGDRQRSLDYRARAIADGTGTDVYIQQGIAARLLAQLGRFDEAYALSKYVVRRDPACTACVGAFAYVLRLAGRHQEAAAELEKLLEWREPGPEGYWSIGVAWLVAGDPAKALRYFDSTDEGATVLGRLMALHDLGRTEEFEAEFAEMIENLEPDGSESVARVAAWTGQNDLAFEYLDRMVEVYGPEFVPNVRTDLYEPIKSDPRWQAFLERHGASDDEMAGLTFDPPLPPEVVEEVERMRAERENSSDD